MSKEIWCDPGTPRQRRAMEEFEEWQESIRSRADGLFDQIRERDL